MEPSRTDPTASRGWCQLPRLGEAKKPGPPCNFDEAEADEFDDSEPEQPLPGDMDWLPDTDEGEPDEAHREGDVGAADRGEVEWQEAHAKHEFVTVPNKKRTKKSKFEGPHQGWVFKSGMHGLGYYRD